MLLYVVTSQVLTHLYHSDMELEVYRQETKKSK